jgi:hypothetical protein
MNSELKILPIPRSLSVIYADDMRQEMGDKITIVGMYQNQMVFPSLPAQVLKLAVFLTATSSIDRPFRKLVFRLFKNDEMIFEQAISDENLSVFSEKSTSVSEGSRSTVGMDASLFVLLPPLSFDAPGAIRCHAETEEGIMIGRPLIVTDAALSKPAETEVRP